MEYQDVDGRRVSEHRSESIGRGGWLRFFDTFFQERNIHWILGLGMLILLGSSLMLVTSRWDQYTPAWKHLILLGYVVGVHLAGQAAWRSLGLRKTGAGLMLLTVLLLPVTFLAMRWIHPGDVFTPTGILRQTGLLALLAVNTVFAALASARIFRHVLRGHQPTFVVAYVVLCVAGAFVPALPAAAAPVVTLLLWLVFAAGAVKVNRHVFWLMEEHRWPRVCGFFPILLLGGQFFALYAAGLATHLRLEWVGLGLVLTGIPALLTADTLARVFLERNGTIARPLPWSVVLPIFVGLMLTLAGVVLAGLRFPATGMVVPTAALAAVMMAVVAHRTGKQAFVWAMLAGVLIAYQGTPVFFREFAMRVIREGAAAVREQRLPVAFYGLTNLPLLLTTTVASVWRRRRGDDLFGRPLKHLSLVLPVFLLVASLTHVKATFPVGLALAGLFAVQATLYLDRRVLVPLILGWLAATHGFALFASEVLGWTVSSDLPLLAWTVSAVLLLFPGASIDQQTLQWLHVDQRKLTIPMFRATSLVVAMGVAAFWLMQSFSALPFGPLASPVVAVVCVLLLATHAIHWPHRGLGDLTIVFATLTALFGAVTHGWTAETLADFAAPVCGVIWLAAIVLQRRPTSRIAEAFLHPAQRASAVGMLLVLVFLLAPAWFATLGFHQPFVVWTSSALATLWLFDAARRVPAPLLVTGGWFALLATAGAAQVTFAPSLGQAWLPALWAAMALVAVPVMRLGAERHSLSTPLGYSVLATLIWIALASLFVFTTPLRVAGGIALAALLLLAMLWKRSTLRRLALMTVNWQVVCLMIQVFAPDIRRLVDLTLPTFAGAALPVAFVAAAQALLWRRSLNRDAAEDRELVVLQSLLLQVLALGALVASVERRSLGADAWDVALALVTFAALIADRVLTAVAPSQVARALCPSAMSDTGGQSARPTDVARLADSTVALALCPSGECTTQCGPTEPSDLIDGRAKCPAYVTEFPAHGSTRTTDELQDRELHVWLAQAQVVAAVGWLLAFDVVRFGHGLSLYVIQAAGWTAWAVARWAARHPRATPLVRPLSSTGFVLPMLVVLLGVLRHAAGTASPWLGANSLALLLAGGFYFWQGLERRRHGLIVAAVAVLNVSLALLWRELHWSDPQFFLIPFGVSVLILVELLRAEIPEKFHDPLRYAGALMILVSPTFHIVDGSWMHLFSLMAASTLVTLAAMGMRVRALMYAGTAFLIADLAAMVVRGSVDEPSILWIAGIALGTAIIALAAYCERHREKMLQRLRLIAAELESWR